LSVLHRIDLRSADGRVVPALYQDAGPRAALLVHGITSQKEEDGGFYLTLARRFAEMGLSVLSIDLPGHGDSPMAFEDTAPSLMVEDVAAALAFLCARHTPTLAVCASFGASVYLLARSAGLPLPDAAVLLNPVTDYRTNFVCADLPWGRTFAPQLEDANFWALPGHAVHGGPLRLGRRMLSELALLSPQAVRLPESLHLLVLLGTADEVISLASVRAFVNSRAPRAAEFDEVPGAGHGFHGFRPQVQARICEFVQTLR
jgi:pimeloyl-ACP methyl ester carboxylesterase